VIRDRAARTGKLVQAGYTERVLRTLGMWDCNPVLSPLDPNVRLTKRDSPEVVDPDDDAFLLFLQKQKRESSSGSSASTDEEYCVMSLIT
jgi:hypothetical protein